MTGLVELLPGARDEAFKYTSFKALARQDFSAPPDPQLESAALPATNAPRLCFVDGRFAPDLSSLEQLPEGVTVDPARPGTILETDNALAAMNAALDGDGCSISVTGEVGTLELLFIASDHTGQYASHPRVRIEVADNAVCTVVQRHLALGTARDFTNVRTELRVGAGARVVHILDQRAAAGATLATGLYAAVAQDARLDSHAVHLGGGLVRADIQVRLQGRGAHCALYGLHLPGMRQHIDTHSRVDHLVPDTRSDELYHVVVDRGGRSVFNGKVVVAEGADRTDARQYNANLLLSAQAEADTKPELEIYADDVQCAHGATVGKLDEKALFYLRSRGIGLEQARSVLVWAFVETVLGQLPDEGLRHALEDAVLSRLPDAETIREFR